MISEFVKDPQAYLDYKWDWSSYLSTGETVVSGIITVPDGLVLEDTVVGSNYVTAWLSGGVVPEQYTVICNVTTNQGRIDERSISIIVQDR
jgi:hypothetical protein